jgi:hypothetical protein
MGTRVIGVDPGKKGAVAILDGDGHLVDLMDMPVVGGKLYDRLKIAQIILSQLQEGHYVHVLIEEPIFKPQKKIPQPCNFCKKTNWIMKFDTPRTIASQWVGFELWEGIIVGIQALLPYVNTIENVLTYETVQPSKWMKKLFGSTKLEPKLACFDYSMKRWPGAAWMGPRGGHRQDRHDAACLAAYGLRQLPGGDTNEDTTPI